MKARINSDEGKRIYSHHMSTVEPVFANLERNKGLKRFSLRGKKSTSSMAIFCCGTQYREIDTEDWVIIAELLQGKSIMQLYRDLPLSACFEVLKEAGIAGFQWLFDIREISATKVVFLQSRYS